MIDILGAYDLDTEAGRKAGYDKVLQVFVKEYGERVLATPKSSFPWLIPSVAAVGALGLIIVVGRRYMRRRAAELAATKKPPSEQQVEDKYVDKLEDELSETD